MRSMQFLALGLLATTIPLAAATPSHAQTPAPRSSVDMPVSPPVQEFRDPKTGQVWTVNNVGLQSGPPTPQDLAFDPLAQAAVVQGVITQRVRLGALSTVPITAGPTVPIVNIGDAALSAVPGQRWQVVLYIQNNSAGTVTPLLHCTFTNSGQVVEKTNVLVPALGPGIRAGTVVYGPKTTLFVDRARCDVKSP